MTAAMTQIPVPTANEETDPTKKQYIKKVTPLEDWIAEQKAQNP